MRFVRTMLPRVAPTPFLSARPTLDIAAFASHGVDGRQLNVDQEVRLNGRLEALTSAASTSGASGGHNLPNRTTRALDIDGRQLKDAGSVILEVEWPRAARGGPIRQSIPSGRQRPYSSAGWGASVPEGRCHQVVTSAARGQPCELAARSSRRRRRVRAAPGRLHESDSVSVQNSGELRTGDQRPAPPGGQLSNSAVVDRQVLIPVQA